MSNGLRRFSLFAAFLAVLILPSIGIAQFYFGRNKIQYDHFDWQVYSTEHFNIYYYTEEQEIARAAAYFTEEAFREYELKFNHTITHPIPLIIYSNHIHFQQTNIYPYMVPEGVGGFFEFVKKRVVIPYNGNMQDFRKVLRHELVHVFMHHKINIATEDLGAWEAPNFPLWFTEGIADYWAEGWDAQAELILRDAVLHDYLFPLDSYELMASGFLLYKVGQSFLRFFEERYGADRLRMLMEDYWQYENFDDALGAMANKKFEDLEAEWRVALKQQYAESLPEQDVILPGQNQITQFGPNCNPKFYTDLSGKKHIVYLTSRGGYTDIVSQLIGEKKSTTIVSGERNADRESLHFLQTDFSISDDGKLAYVTKSGRQDAIRIVDVATRQEITSLQHPDLITIRSPKISADGKRVIFSAQVFGGQPDIYFWDIEKAEANRLTDDIYTDIDPCFDPTAEFVVFSSDRERPALDTGMNLFLMRIEDRTIRRLTQNEDKEVKPIWITSHPARIYYLSDRNGTDNAYFLDIDNIDIPDEPRIDIHQMTDYHTGLQDLYPGPGDSLLTSVFMNYNFQLYYLPTHGDSIIKTVTPAKFDVPDSSWKIPGIRRYSIKESRPYRLRYSLDFAQTNVVQDPIFGFLGGAQLGVSDLLGNRYYHFLLANSAQTTSEILDRFNLALTMVDLSRRSNRAIGIFHFANDYYDPYQGFFFERAMGIRGALNYPIDTFRRLEFSLSWWSSRKDYYFGKVEDAYLISNFFSFVHDNSIWTFTGPIDGWCLRLMAGPTFDFLRSQLHNYTVLLDFRYYYRPVPFMTFAQRSMFWFNDGVDIRRFYIGGSWGLRGYGLYQIYGRKYVMLNNELRFPFARSLMLRTRTTAIGLSPIRAALFFDVGNAWDYHYHGLIGSFGAGLRGLFLGGLVLRLDVGKKTDFHDLEKGLFVQFFFGWDY